MSETMIGAWLLVMLAMQAAWCVFYASTYDWRSTPLGPVWLAKGSALVLLWATLLADRFADVPDWVFAYVVGPLLFAGTLSWLVVTIRVRLHRSDSPRP